MPTSLASLEETLSDDLARQVIVVMKPLDFEKLSYDPVSRDAVDPYGVLALPEDLPVKQVPLLRTLAIRGLWTGGSILAQNPYYSDQYEMADRPEVPFAQARLRIMVEVAHLLGATSFDYIESEATESESEKKAHARGGKAMVKAGAEIDAETRTRLRRGVEIHHKWDGRTPDASAARSLLEETNLEHDSVLMHLIRLREGENSHRSVTEKFDLLSEASHRIALASKVSAGIYGGEAGAKVHQNRRVEYKVTFAISY